MAHQLYAYDVARVEHEVQEPAKRSRIYARQLDLERRAVRKKMDQSDLDRGDLHRIGVHRQNVKEHGGYFSLEPYHLIVCPPQEAVFRVLDDIHPRYLAELSEMANLGPELIVVRLERAWPAPISVTSGPVELEMETLAPLMPVELNTDLFYPAERTILFRSGLQGSPSPADFALFHYHWDWLECELFLRNFLRGGGLAAETIERVVRRVWEVAPGRGIPAAQAMHIIDRALKETGCLPSDVAPPVWQEWEDEKRFVAQPRHCRWL